MKKILLILLFIVGSFTYSHAGIEFPADMPTITALINLHKKMAKAEDASVNQVNTSYAVTYLKIDDNSQKDKMLSDIVKKHYGEELSMPRVSQHVSQGLKIR